MDKYQSIASDIYKLVGGNENVASYAHCMTRLRLTLVDRSIVDHAALKAIDGVIGVVEEGTLQIILGPGVVNKVHDQFGQILDAANEGSGVTPEELAAKGAAIKAANKEKNDTSFKRLLAKISAVFIPMIPAFVGAGLIAGLQGIMQNMITVGTLEADAWVQINNVLAVMKSGMYSYLVIFTGIFAAKAFGATPSLGGVIGAMVLLPGMNPEQPIMNIFTGEPLTSGLGGIIGVLIAVALLTVVEKSLRKVVPDAFDIILVPFISLLITGMATLFFIMPLAGWISFNLVSVINALIETGGIVAGFILGFSFLPMVMTGLHQILTPIHIEMIEQTGETVLLPILAMAGAGQVGAAIALWVRCRKNQLLTNTIKGALPVGVMGVGEPLIYGVSLPLGRPFLTACIGGGIGGAVVAWFGGIGASAVGPSGAALIPLITDGDAPKFIFALFTAYIGGFLATYFFGIPKEAMLPTTKN